jgi:glutamate synthase (NADPH/NADH) small chain
MDACRTAVRLGATEIYNIYRRTKAEMPAEAVEIEEAGQEGVIFKNLTNPIEIIGKGGKVKAVRLQVMELGEPDASGRRRPVPTGKYSEMVVDTVIVALGTGPNPIIQQSAEQEALKLETDKWRYIVVDENGQTSAEGIYAGGDVAPAGESTAIAAMGAGKRAAASIIKKLTGAN